MCIIVNESICQGHCEIVPFNHCNSLVNCDEEIRMEIMKYRKSLYQYFYHNFNQGLVFLETVCSINPTHPLYHCHLDVIPIQMKYISDVSIYFKQVYY